MTEKQELERKILLQQQAIRWIGVNPNSLFLEVATVKRCRERIRANRRKLWELEGGANQNSSL